MHTSTARFRYHGTGGSLLGLVLMNALLTVVTLGIYSFWARNKVRQFHYSHTEMDGDRFAYHGTGGELFRGYLKAMGIIMLLGVGLAVATGLAGSQAASPGVQIGLMFAFYAAILILVIAAINGARRYRTSRSSWRGIRFSFHGDTGEFVMLMLKGIALSVVTLGFYLPTFQSDRRAFLVSHARFGSEPFMYDGSGRELFGEFVKAWLLTLPTLGLYWIWYSAFRTRYLWGRTAMRGARFNSTITGAALFKLHLTNLALVVFTLGIGATWAIVRTHAFWCDNLALVGTVDWAAIQQQAQSADATAEGVADAFDVDVGFGM